MPRLSASSTDETLQGSLFGEPEPAPSTSSAEVISDPGELSDTELGADAAAAVWVARQVKSGQHLVDAKSRGQRNGTLVPDVVVPEHEVAQHPVDAKGVGECDGALGPMLLSSSRDFRQG